MFVSSICVIFRENFASFFFLIQLLGNDGETMKDNLTSPLEMSHRGDSGINLAVTKVVDIALAITPQLTRLMRLESKEGQLVRGLAHATTTYFL